MVIGKNPLPKVEITPHPDHAWFNEKTIEWARKFELGSEETLALLKDDTPGLYAASVVPTADPRVIQLCADYFAWLILFDDAMGECADVYAVKRLSGFIEAYRGDGYLPWGALPYDLLAAAHDLASRSVQTTKPDGHLVQFSDSLLGYMEGCFRESTWRIGSDTPTLAEYVPFRLFTIGAEPVLDIIELTLTGPLGSDAVSKRHLQDVRRRACLLFAWANDVITYKACRTEADEEDRLNLITVIDHEEGGGVDAAKAQAFRLYGWEQNRLIQDLGSWLSHDASTPTGQYARAIMTAVDGNQYWYENSPRYRGR